jgi:hypothetical protein
MNLTYEVQSGGPEIDWKERHDSLMKHAEALGAAASLLKEAHKASAHCEFPRTCGGCHFWSGVIEACDAIRVGDKSVINQAMLIINKQNK